ncbi:MAG: hypothetical protein M1813_004204 [Trichoglossum hirsutum]|nr:MAG: hypothetical protein M1813_004204 [Trichoglossum hirsutum]
MPGGYLHSPVWTPYALYGTVDYIYGWPAYNSHNGFTAAQSTMNILESSLYIWYLWIVYSSGVLSVGEGRGAPGARIAGALGRGRVVSGRMAGTAALVGFGAAVMTLSKTLLYWLNEYFSGFENIGHNSLASLIPLWIIPNGAWIVLPAYMSYVFAAEILDGLSIAAGTSENAFDKKAR